MEFNFLFTAAGFVVGFIVGMTGVGGGSLMTPILVLGFNISPTIAVGTDLLYAAITKSSGIIFHNKQQNIDWEVVKYLCIGSIPASLLSIYILKNMYLSGINYDHIITSSLSVALILTSLVLIFRKSIQTFASRDSFSWIRDLHHKLQKPVTIACGVLIGSLVTLSSVGAGAFGAAVLLFLYPKLKTIQIIGTDLAHAVPITLLAGLGHMHIGTVDFTLLLGLILGSLPGIFLGSRVASLLPDKIIRPILATMLFLIGVKMAF